MFELFTLLQSIFTFDWVFNHLTNNDFLVAGVFAAVAFVFRSIPSKIMYFINRQISIEFTLTNEDSDYEDIVKFLESKRIRWFSRTYTKKKGEFYYDGEYKAIDSELTIGYGTSWFFINGSLGYVSRAFKETNAVNKLKEEVFIKLFTRNVSKLQFLIDKSVEHKKVVDNTLSVYLPESSYWNSNSKITKRTFETVFIEENIKEQIKDALDNFAKSKDWYLSKGIPYKFGIFIEGEPGTGKTSLVKAICSYVDKNMYFMTSGGFNEAQLPPLISELCRDEKSLLVLEEIDTFNSTEIRNEDNVNNESGKKINNMSVILNVMDGVLTPDNFMFIATSNHYDKIDPAIKRPGRFDLVIRVGRLSFEVFVKMVSVLYEVNEEIVEKDFKNIYVPITGSVVQGTFILEKEYKKGKDILIEKMIDNKNEL